MVYDFEEVAPHGPPVVTSAHSPDPKDLEAIVTLMQLAAIWLTPSPDATFSEGELLAQMRELGDEEVRVADADARIVLQHARFLRTERGRYRLK